MLFSGESLLFVDIDLVGGSDLLGLASGEGCRGVSEDVASISDLGVSEGVLRSALSLLDVVDFVVVDLLSVD